MRARGFPSRIVFWAFVAVMGGLLAACAGQIVPPAPAVSTPEASPTVAEPTEVAQPAETPTMPAPSPTEELELLPPSGEVDGIPVGFTRDGHAYRGNPDATVVMVEYSEYQCPYCGRHVRETAPRIRDEYIRSGKVVHVFRDFPLDDLHPQARKAAEAARCAGEQGAEQFWLMHDALFRRVEQWAGRDNAVDIFKSYGQELGLDREAFEECLDSGRTSAAIDADLEAGMAAGVRGTPTFFLNDYRIVGAQPFEAFQSAIDALLEGRTPPTPEPRIPYWATAEGMSPDPERSGYTMAGDVYKGSPDAPVVIFEFSDFQCPYCRRFAMDTAPQLDQEYVKTGKVRFIYKHFPLSFIHANAEAAAIASECAGQQGKFWEMHDRLFETQEEWAKASDAPSFFSSLAEEIGLDLQAYQACVEAPEARGKVVSDFSEARRIGLRGTPTFIILKGESGQLIPGALPYEQFKQVLDKFVTEE
ncbi:MAG TPA: DsbA family protein [Caldilineae bacterium]|nr:DsbA family protein [Caldilineae bacterium]